MRITRISVVLTAALLLGLPAISQGAAAKLGAKCAKINSTSGSLICKKSGNKLTWQRKVVAKPTPQPAISPTPSPSAQSTPTISPTPTPAPEPTGPSAPITFDNLDSKWTASIARKNLADEYAKLTQPKSAAIYHVGPTVKEDLYAEEKRLLTIFFLTILISELIPFRSYGSIFQTVNGTIFWFLLALASSKISTKKY
jgi:hypothetical protein